MNARSTNTRNNPLSFLLLAIGLISLVGCSGSARENDLEEFYATVQSQGKGRIKPLPPFETVAPFSYQAGNLRSPFEPPVLAAVRQTPKGGRAVKPDPTRVKQFLEQFNVGQLAMVGTLAQGDQLYGLVRDYEEGCLLYTSPSPRDS